MKKFVSYVSAFAMAMALTVSFSSCSSSDDDNTNPETGKTVAQEQAEALKEISAQIVDATIHDTYKNLADSASLLADQLQAMRESAKTKSVTQAQVEKACELFKGARANYEKSEAFLLGAASMYNVDPHIDSWPLDVDALAAAMNNPNNIAGLDSEDGDVYANGQFGSNCLGFHGIEFILFYKGEARNAAQFNGTAEKDDVHQVLTCSGEEELIYAAAVAGDLRNNCYILQCGWDPTSDKSHAAKLDDIEQNYLMSSGIGFGEDFKEAITYRSTRAALAAILTGDHGAMGICDEVAKQKIGRPYSGTSDEDINYIESPYSYNSITDFYDNIVSIEDVWYGGMANNRNANKSFSAYFAKYHAAEGKAVETAISNAQAEIKKMKRPFVLNRTDAQAGKAIQALNTLSDALKAANQALQAE